MTGFRPNRTTGFASRRLRRLVVVLALGLPCCTTPMRPTMCGGPQKRACGERHDVWFCENVALAVEGADCANVGLRVGKPFCYVSAGPCVERSYALEAAQCVVVRYAPKRDWYECSPGTPIFGP